MYYGTVNTTAAGKVTLIAMTAAMYAVAKGLTAFIPTPFGVGQFLLFIFVPAFFAIVGDTLSAAIGAGMGTFLGDAIFLTPLGQTNPALSLVSGVPAVVIAVPLLLRAIRPLVGRSSILAYYPSWSDYEVRRLLPASLGYAVAF